MNPNSAHQFYFEELTLEEYTSVFVSHIESPNSIYVVKVSLKKKRFLKVYLTKLCVFISFIK